MLPASPFAASQTHTTEKITETAAPCLAALLCPVFTKTRIYLRLEQCRLVSAPAAGQAALFALLPGVGGPFHAADVDPHQSPSTILGLLWEKNAKQIIFDIFLILCLCPKSFSLIDAQQKISPFMLALGDGCLTVLVLKS